MTVQKLRPCPFCGESEALHPTDGKFRDEPMSTIVCQRCHAWGPIAKDWDKAREKWDDRINEEEMY
jgi:Lar family restriction alleviation protein